MSKVHGDDELDLIHPPAAPATQQSPSWHFDSTEQHEQEPHTNRQWKPPSLILSPTTPMSTPPSAHCPRPFPAASPAPSPRFLHTLLNPIESSFGYTFGGDNNMSGSGPSARLPNGYVDLTNDSPDVTTVPSGTKRGSPTPGPSTKKLRRNDGTAVKVDNAESALPEATVEEIDISNDKQTVQDVLQKQREEAVKAQTRPEEKAATFNTINCVICMDTPTDLTATACGMSTPFCFVASVLIDLGHLFCHTCLMEALIAGENRGNPGEQRRPQCPVCRKNINRSKASDIIPLLLKKGSATQPRKTRPIGATEANVTVTTSKKALAEIDTTTDKEQRQCEDGGLGILLWTVNTDMNERVRNEPDVKYGHSPVGHE
ncbi:hypothetical protein N0V90_001311 [Kalmusia sp. IMI 367209]|nr:hypothetical protein N0V90_001311 [Kalmusia sp. IMI 367209]